MKKNKKNNKIINILKYSLTGMFMIAGFIVFVVGLSIYMNLDLSYDKAKIKCDDKDYSSYVKYTETTTPGNEKINRQLEVIEQTLQSSIQANDTGAMEYWWKQYNDMLALQSQTSTTTGHYDYSEADKAKQKCYSLAEKQKDSDRTNGIVLLSVGCGIFVISAGVLVYLIVSGIKKH